MNDDIAFPINIGCTGCSIVPCIGIGKKFYQKKQNTNNQKSFVITECFTCVLKYAILMQFDWCVKELPMYVHTIT